MSTTTRPMRADARRNYQKLVTTASEVISEQGADASLDEIARRAGVGIGTLYRHFPTRETLLEAVYRDYIEALCTRAYDLGRTLPPWDALYEWLRDFIDNSASRRGLATTLKKSVDASSSVFNSCHDVLRAAGNALLEPAQECHAVRSDVELTHLFRLVHGIALATENSADGPELAERMLGLVMDGARYRP
jgi:AcrR family transcriptional regulator